MYFKFYCEVYFYWKKNKFLGIYRWHSLLYNILEDVTNVPLVATNHNKQQQTFVFGIFSKTQNFCRRRSVEKINRKKGRAKGRGYPVKRTDWYAWSKNWKIKYFVIDFSGFVAKQPPFFISALKSKSKLYPRAGFSSRGTQQGRGRGMGEGKWEWWSSSEMRSHARKVRVFQACHQTTKETSHLVFVR